MIPVTRPTMPPYEDVEPAIREIFESGMITNGKHVMAFEEKAAAFLGVRYAVTAPNCTIGMMALFSLLPPGSEVIMPATTFSATYQAALWNGLKAVLVDCNESMNLDADLVEGTITPNTSAIVGVHLYGTATDIEKLEEIAQRNNVRLFFDAAHGFGGKYKGTYYGGFGDAEVFSLGPTKTVPVGEGGLITTNDEQLARDVRLVCNHGQPKVGATVDSMVKSFNGRMEEINAAIGIRILDDVDRWVNRRQELAKTYYRLLGKVPGISFPFVPHCVVSTYKDFCILVELEEFGIDRNQLKELLDHKGIQTRLYFYPPVHMLGVAKSRGEFVGVHLPKTEHKTSHVLALPMYSHLGFDEVEYVCRCVAEARLAGG